MLLFIVMYKVARYLDLNKLKIEIEKLWKVENKKIREEAAVIAVGTFFWFLIVFLEVLIVAGIFMS